MGGVCLYVCLSKYFIIETTERILATFVIESLANLTIARIGQIINHSLHEAQIDIYRLPQNGSSYKQIEHDIKYSPIR